MRRIAVAALCLMPSVAMAQQPAPPSPLVQACAQSATEQMQQGIVFHAQLIEAQQEIARLKAELAAAKKKPDAPVHR